MWHDLLSDVTPVQRKGDLLFKRDDLFAPLGPGGINGSKLRQCIWLLSRAHTLGYPGLVSGASVRSPQLMMTTAVANHYGMKSHHVIGATGPLTMRNHISVDIALRYGATFDIIKVAYNPALQRKVRELLAGEYKGWWHLEYGISLDHKTHDPQLIEEFHRVGAQQVQNLPDEMETLVVPAGSCNSLVSILYGLHLYPPKNLKKIVMMEIGPEKLHWVRERLDVITQARGDNKVIENFSRQILYEWEYHALHSRRVYTYNQQIKFNLEDISFHPTYEGKVMTWLTTHLPHYVNPATCVWIVGGEVNREYMISMAEKRGENALLSTEQYS